MRWLVLSKAGRLHRVYCGSEAACRDEACFGASGGARWGLCSWPKRLLTDRLQAQGGRLHTQEGPLAYTRETVQTRTWGITRWKVEPLKCRGLPERPTPFSPVHRQRCMGQVRVSMGRGALHRAAGGVAGRGARLHFSAVAMRSRLQRSSCPSHRGHQCCCVHHARSRCPAGSCLPQPAQRRMRHPERVCCQPNSRSSPAQGRGRSRGKAHKREQLIKACGAKGSRSQPQRLGDSGD